MSEPTATPPAEAPEPSRGSALARSAAASMNVCKAPASPLARSLRLGLMLVLVSFSAKLLVLDLAISNAGTGLQPERVGLKTQAKLNAVRGDLADLEHEIATLSAKRTAARMEGIRGDGDSDKMDKLTEEIEERLEKKNEEKKKLERKLAPKIDKVELQGQKARQEARDDAVADGADAIFWLQSALGWKVLFDLIKILGCFLILGATVGIVSSKDEEPALKVFATCCGTIMLLSMTAWALLSYLS